MPRNLFAVHPIMFLSPGLFPEDKIADFGRRWNVRELSLFGSVVRSDFGSKSDIDILIDFDEDSRWGLFDHIQMQRELEEIFGRKVDLISKRAVINSGNRVIRQEIQQNAQVIFSSCEEAYAPR